MDEYWFLGGTGEPSVGEDGIYIQDGWNRSPKRISWSEKNIGSLPELRGGRNDGSE